MSIRDKESQGPDFTPRTWPVSLVFSPAILRAALPPGLWAPSGDQIPGAPPTARDWREPCPAQATLLTGGRSPPLWVSTPHLEAGTPAQPWA